MIGLPEVLSHQWLLYDNEEWLFTFIRPSLICSLSLFRALLLLTESSVSLQVGPQSGIQFMQSARKGDSGRKALTFLWLDMSTGTKPDRSSS